ncbi:MAG: hypothetical protein KGI54_17415 [Pseudomonadota bacterium]|nr:hypothetical protein [Pseudomonadota bacterium]
MIKENAKDYLPLVQALADGKTIQYSRNGVDWEDAGVVTFTWAACRYRIKPEPIKRYGISWISKCYDYVGDRSFETKNEHLGFPSISAVADFRDRCVPSGDYAEARVFVYTIEKDRPHHEIPGSREYIKCKD